jgi:hypothetical protein
MKKKRNLWFGKLTEPFLLAGQTTLRSVAETWLPSAAPRSCYCSFVKAHSMKVSAVICLMVALFVKSFWR